MQSYALTDNETAYLAGIVDAKGVFDIKIHCEDTSRAYQYYHAILKVSTVDKHLVEWITSKTYARRRKIAAPSVFEEKRDVDRAEFTAWSLDAFLPKIYPYLIAKRRHCEIMMRMRDTFRHHKLDFQECLSKDVHKIRHECFQEMRALAKERRAGSRKPSKTR